MEDRAGVRATYERIGAHFATTREYPWPEVEEFCADRAGALALDVGCGNGRHAALLTDCAERTLAVDLSRELLAVARERAPGAERLEADAASLPIAADAVDLAVYVATLHHLPERALRRRSLGELGRVLAPGGAALVSAWSTAHERFEAAADATEGFDTELEWTLPDGETVPRYYHIYAPAEFEADLRAAGLGVEASFLSSGNCYAVVGGG